MTPKAHGAAVPYLSIAGRVAAADVGVVRRRVRAFAAEHGASAQVLAAIQLAVTEAVVNAVKHGYGGAGGEVRVDVDVEDGELEVVVADGGRGFESDSDEGLGLGLALMRAGASAFEVRDRPLGGVEVWMRFQIG
jgi:anti-sigma regulatory factor (Ser/Thr protein kinase)